MRQDAETFSLAMSWAADALAGPSALYWLGGRDFLVSPGSGLTLGETGAGSVVPWHYDDKAIFPLALPAIGEPAARAPLALAADSPLAFDRFTGQLMIRTAGGEHTVHETQALDGFVEVTVDGQEHSSNPRSASFDRALAGATGATVVGIRFAGDSQDTLIVGSQHGRGPMTVQATGAAVVTENVVAAGPLAIEAPNITVNGSLQGSSVSLAASGWVTVHATGRIDSVPAASGGGIGIAAAMFVNSGQLHADGSASDPITVKAHNILNAGPITGDSTGPGMPADEVRIAFTGAYLATTAAVVSASSAAGSGGQITIDGGSAGRLYTSGQQRATGVVGGAVDLLGRDIILAGATVDASGTAGGGSVRIGSDVPGRWPEGWSTKTITVTAASRIRADAQWAGTGGRVSLGAEQATAFDGAVSARGGPAGGAGGFIEVSGQGNLSYGGSADAGARLGKSGTLLLDPKNIIISDAPAGVFPQYDLIDPHPTVGGTFGGTNFSLVGYVPGSTLVLSNGNLLVPNINDDFGGSHAGALYLFDGRTGALLSSLVGSSANEQVGNYMVLLRNGNYVVDTPNWNGNRGAVTWGSATAGVSGVVSADNSLVGSNPGDQVGWTYYAATATLNNGNYVVQSPNWNGGRGAVTLGNGDTGIRGTISEANSLVGRQSGDRVGGVVQLNNGDYVVNNYSWNGNRGAVTWGSGTQGITGVVSAANSLVGSNPNEQVGQYSSVTPLANGNYVVSNCSWNGNRGAVTWGDGQTGITGEASEVNSLVGQNRGDFVGGVWRLTNGNYVVASPSWNGSRGAVTWANGATGIYGVISTDNSLVGSNPSDRVGSGIPGGFEQPGKPGVIPLRDGSYVVSSPFWNGDRGTATWGSGTASVVGVVSADNSLVGSNPGDALSNGGISSINGNYVVFSRDWNGTRGAVTWGSGTQGVRGILSDANSLVGSSAGDRVGNYGIQVLGNSDYVVLSRQWDGGRGASTWIDGTSGQTLDGLGVITPQNSLFEAPRIVANPVAQTFLAIIPTASGGRVTVGLTSPSQLAYATAQGQTLTITPQFLTRTLDTGTAVILQASNDLIVNSPIMVNAGGQGGALTLQAGRSILLNASITTDNGPLMLLANDTLAHGVVDAQRDPGSAVITMAAGTTLDTGSAPLTVELRDGAGLTNADNGPIMLQTVTAGSLSVANNGPSPGSDLILGPVTTSGPQSYANPHGTASLTGNLTAADNPITFTDSVVLHAGLTLSTGSGNTNFAGGTVLPDLGMVSIAGGVLLTGSTTLLATLQGTDSGSYTQLVVSGAINLGGSMLSLNVGFEPPVGRSFEIFTNTGGVPITGMFAGLDEGAVFTQSGYSFQVSYQGGMGGDSIVVTRLS